MDCQKASEPEATGAAEAEAAGEAGAASSRSADATWCLCPSFVTPSALSCACNACVEKQGGSRHASARMAPSRRDQRQRAPGAARRVRPAVAKSASRAARWLALLGLFSASRGQSAWPHRACSRHGTVPAGRRRCRAAAARRAGRRGRRTPPLAGRAAPASLRGSTQQPAVPRWPCPPSGAWLGAPTNMRHKHPRRVGSRLQSGRRSGASMCLAFITTRGSLAQRGIRLYVEKRKKNHTHSDTVTVTRKSP